MRPMRLLKNRWLVRALIALGVALLAFERVAPLGLHSNAKLTKTDKQQLIDGLRKTYAAAGIKGG